MKPRNAEVQSKIKCGESIFRAVRRADFPTQVRAKMIEKNLKNVDIAERLGVTEANISRWLRGNQNLGIDTLYQLADAIEEPLTLMIGNQIKQAAVEKFKYEPLIEKAGEDQLMGKCKEEEAPLLTESSSPSNSLSKVIQLSSYARLRRATPRTDFAVARSLRGVEVNWDSSELMVK